MNTQSLIKALERELLAADHIDIRREVKSRGVSIQLFIVPRPEPSPAVPQVSSDSP